MQVFLQIVVSLLLLNGAYWFVTRITREFVKNNGILWRLLGILVPLFMGGFCVYLGLAADGLSYLITGWMLILGGVLVTILGIWTALAKTGQETKEMETSEEEQLEK